jgi:phosphoenolpyruvate carboxylase
LSPENADDFLREYKGLATVTIQSAFRYDYPLDQVKECITLLNHKLPNGEPVYIDPAEENILLSILRKCRKHYEEVIELLAPLVNRISAYVPQRRTRKLHIGLFGYSRNVAGVNLPRAIPFSAALYSIGIPPEFFGAKVLEDLTAQEWETTRKHYINMENDLRTVGGYVSWENMKMLTENSKKIADLAGMSPERLSTGLARVQSNLRTVEEKLGISLGPNTPNLKRYENFANNFLIALMQGEDEEAKKSLIETAKIRRCLG